MGIIRELPKDVIEKIAAGEVVERPASVIKELVENAIDAGATSIRVDLSDGGRKHIAVMDDGAGMEADDLARSVVRHATSKIATEADLWAIRTMGFRGEALAAIGAVSRLTIESRPNRADVLEGARIRVEGGAVDGSIAVGCPGGTSVVVADLFYNVPARQKFLRSATVELGHAQEAVTELSLACPGIRFELTADGKRRFLSAGGDQKHRVGDVLGGDVAERLVAVEERGDGVALFGWVADGGRAGARDVHFFLNRRPVRDKLLMHALTAAFGESLSRGQYPVAALWLDVDPARVDVNVHPTKREVRFASGGAIHDFVMAAVRKTLQSRDPLSATRDPVTARIAGGVASAIERYEQSRLIFQNREQRTESVDRGSWIVDREARSDRLRFTDHESRFADDGSRVPVHGSRFTDHGLRILGQLASTYIVCEDENGALLLIDQHAAHERLGFDALRSSYAAGDVPRQELLLPERVELGPKALAYAMEHAEAIARAGFEVEPFGGATLIVKTVPAVMGGAAVGGLFDHLATELEEHGASDSLDAEVERIFAVVACHAQVRGGDALSAAELAALVDDIARENVTHCPHGRPALVRVEKSEIEKWFKRRK